MTTNEARKKTLLDKIEDALIEARVYSAENMLQGRELSLVITKLEEAQMWAERITPKPNPSVQVIEGGAAKIEAGT